MGNYKASNYLIDQHDAWDFFSLSYRGGNKYKDGADAGNNSVLVRHEHEEGDEYSRRSMLAALKNYCRPIVDHYNAYIFCQKIERTDNANAQEFFTDVDGQGTTINDYMAEATRRAQYLGLYIVGIDAPEYHVDKISELAKKESGLYSYFRTVDPRAIVDVDFKGETITRIVIKETTRDKPSLMVEECTIVRFVEWTASTWQEYTVDSDENALPNGEPTVHNFGEVPFYPFYFDEAEPLVGISQIEDISECQKKVFNYDSLLDEELYNVTFTQTFLVGVDNPSDVLKGGTNNVICLPTGANVDRKGAVPEQAQNIMTSRDREIKEIYRQANLEGGSAVDKGTAESGIKKILDLEPTHKILKQIAKNAQDVENWLLRLKSKIEGWNEKEIAVSVYPRDFHDVAISGMLDEIKKAFEAFGELPDMVSDELLKSWISQRYDGDKEKIKKLHDAIDAETAERKEKIETSAVRAPFVTDAPMPDNLDKE